MIRSLENSLEMLDQSQPIVFGITCEFRPLISRTRHRREQARHASYYATYSSSV